MSDLQTTIQSEGSSTKTDKKVVKCRCGAVIPEAYAKFGYTECEGCINARKIKSRKSTYRTIAIIAIAIIMVAAFAFIYPSIDGKSDVKISYDTHGGSVTGAAKYKEGTEITLTATPNPGYEFQGWYDSGGKLVSLDNRYITTADRDITYTAKFTLSLCNITFGSYTGGTASGSGAYEYGKYVTLTADPKDGYSFDGWYSGDRRLSSNQTYTFKITGDIAIRPVFYKPLCEITIKCENIATSSNPGSATGAGTYTYNSIVQLNAVPESGFAFKGWYDGNVLLSSDLYYSFTAVDDLSLTAKFDLRRDASFQVSVQSGSTDTSFSVQESRYNADVVDRKWDISQRYSNAEITCAKMGEFAEIHANGPAALTITHTITYKDGTSATHTEEHVVNGTVEKTYTWNYRYNAYTWKVDWWIFDWAVDFPSKDKATLGVKLNFADYVWYRDNSAELNKSIYIADRNEVINSMVTYDDPIIKGLAKTLNAASLSDIDKANYVLSFVQSVKYTLDEDSRGKSEYFKYPYETLFDKTGDCEDTAMLYAAIMKALGYDVVIFELYNPSVGGHAAVGLNVNGASGDYYTYGGVKYYFCETAADGYYAELDLNVGQMHSSFTWNDIRSVYKIN